MVYTITILRIFLLFLKFKRLLFCSEWDLFARKEKNKIK